MCVSQFFDHFNLEYSNFAERAFALMDVERSANSHLQLSFSEFFVGKENPVKDQLLTMQYLFR